MPRLKRLSALPLDNRGGIGVMAAVSGGLICAAAALAVDLGSVALHARKLQGAADLAALAAAADINRAREAGRATAIANMGAAVESTIVRGRYAADAGRRTAERFTPDEAEPNAVRVTLSDDTQLYFGRFIVGRDTVRLHRSATAALPDQTPRAMLSIGSRLAALDGGLANQLLSDLTGSQVSLSVMDYRALADADVSLLGWFDALAVDAGLKVGDYQGLLKHELDAGRALGILEKVAGEEAGSALSRLSRSAVGTKIRLDRLIGLDAEAGQGLAGALEARISALDLAMAMIETGGERQAQLDLGARPGLADLRASVAIGERPNHSPWLTVSDKAEPVIRTAQARVYLRARTAQKLSGLAQVDLPVMIELAAAEARLRRIDCDDAPRVIVETRPGVVTAMIGAVDETRLNDFKRAIDPAPATLLSLAGLVRVTASAKVEAANPQFQPLTFSEADIAAQRSHSAHTTALTQGVAVSLMQHMQLDVHALGLGVGLGGLAQAMGQLLTPLAPTLDAALNGVSSLLGVRVGEADVTVHGVTCPGPGGRPALVG